MRVIPFASLLLAWALAAPALRADAIDDARKAFREAQRNENWKERRAAYGAILDYDGKAAFDEVLDAVGKESNAAVVIEGVRALGRFESPEALAAFDLEAQKARGSRGALLLLARAEQRGTTGLELLLATLAGKDAQQAMLAAAALGRRPSEEGLAALVEALAHKDGHVVAEAARALQAVAWSSQTIPDKTKAELPKPAMPAWLDPARVVPALARALPEARGPARGALVEALESVSQRPLGDNPAAWAQVAEGGEPDAATLQKRVYPAYFFGIPIHAERIVIVMDVNVLTDNAHPFQDRDVLKRLCEVPGRANVPWINLRTIWQFNAAHVARLVRDLPAKGTKFDLIFSGLRPLPVFGRLTSANASTKEAARTEIEKASFFSQNDILGAMNAALDISGSKDSVAWSKGPDLVVCVYSSVPWQAEETDAEVVGATIGLKARLRGVPIHAVGVHEFAYEMMKLFAGLSGGRYLELKR